MELETRVEEIVSRHIGEMTVLCAAVDGCRDRADLERNSIAILSAEHGDPPSHAWFGQHALSPEIRRSGLWNVDFVGTAPDSNWQDLFSSVMCSDGMEQGEWR